MNASQNERKKYLIAVFVGIGLFFFGSLLHIIALSLPFAHNAENINMDNPYYVSIVQYISYVPVLIFFVYFFKDDLMNDFKDLKKNFKTNILTALASFGIMYVLMLVVNIIYEIFGVTGESENEELINKILLSNAALPMIISVCILAPVVEELLFRKVFFGVCQKSFKLGSIVTIIISTLVFSFIHVTDPESFKYIFQYIPMAAVMCYCYYKTNNIYSVILLHMANNILAVIGTYLLA